ncbi:T9SS-dependent choice-of-anchor J family protein [Hymenobacter algoricola]|uniref:Fibronectin type-III domain-containing protein n=1 Tax=Hymenobacter algoricola TaxID=486267 RepID=A0ABP7N0Y2_9BACT
MTNPYTTSRPTKRWRQLGLAAALALGSTSAYAQLDYVPSNASNLAGTYTDLATTGTVITTANNDDANSAVTPIGFSFTFNGTAYTDFVLNTNGFIKLGTTPPSAANIFNFVAAPDLNIIAPLGGIDLTGAPNQTTSPTEFRVSTTGAAGSRVCTIQWENLADKTAQFATIQFQAKLYEGSSRIEFVYGAWTAGTAAPIGVGFLVGLKGASATPADRLFAQKASSATAWTTTVFAAEAGGLIPSHFVRNTFLPDAGRTYRFNQGTPVPVVDATVATVYTLGKLATPTSLPHAVSAAVRNLGNQPLTNLPVTLTVGGANTFSNTQTVASLAAGATTIVTFAPYPATLALGTNNVSVQTTVSGDVNTANNTATYTQVVTPNRATYIDDTQPFAATGIGAGAADGVIATKHFAVQPAAVNEVKFTFAASANNVQPYQVVIFDATGTGGTPGAVLYTSATLTRTPAAGAVTIPLPGVPVSGAYYVGIKEPSGGTSNPQIAYQNEDPLRVATYYFRGLPTDPWTDISATTFKTRLAMEVAYGAAATCLPPTAVTVTGTTGNSGTFTFTGPANGTGYTVIYGVTGFNPATGGTTVTITGSPYTISGLNSSTTYQFYIRANCGATDQSTLSGPFSFTTACIAPIITTFPYAENFDGVAAGTLPCGITVTDSNNDANTWSVIASTSSASAPNAMRYNYSTTNPGDDWFFTPAMFMRAGTRYQLQFKYRANSATLYPERMEVKFGNAATPAAMTTTIFQNANILGTTYTTTSPGTAPTQVAPIVPAANGNVFIGFHAYSLADQFSLFVDDITVVAITGTSAALDRSINVFPNPSTGIVTLDIKGANAKGAMQVEVTNMLGQTIHTSMVSDNQLNKLDLSNLAAGLYTLKVKSGNDYSIRQLVIQK